MKTDMTLRFLGVLGGAATGILAMSAVMGCGVATQVSQTQRSSIEQRLVVRSLERALDQVGLEKFKGKSVAVDVYGLTADKEFAKELFSVQLREQGASISADAKTTDVRLTLFVHSLGVDRGEKLVGIPAFAAPVANVPVPEIALFKTVRNRGLTELQLYAFDTGSGKLVEVSPVAVGNSKYDEYRILLGIDFALDDLEAAPPEGGEK